jgi:hypothetical protein
LLLRVEVIPGHRERRPPGTDRPSDSPSTYGIV